MAHAASRPHGKVGSTCRRPTRTSCCGCGTGSETWWDFVCAMARQNDLQPAAFIHATHANVGGLNKPNSDKPRGLRNSRSDGCPQAVIACESVRRSTDLATPIATRQRTTTYALRARILDCDNASRGMELQWVINNGDKNPKRAVLCLTRRPLHTRFRGDGGGGNPMPSGELLPWRHVDSPVASRFLAQRRNGWLIYADRRSCS